MKKKLKDVITLKWGTLKSWNLQSKQAKSLMEEYYLFGSSMGAAQQEDTLKQKKIICKLIELNYGKVYLDWDGKYVSKKEAKKYVTKYGKE